MARIPSLLQLCAEIVAKHARKNRKLRKHLKHIQFPPIHISYVKKKKYKALDFSTFIKAERSSSRIIPSLPKMCINHEFKITVGSENALYVSTIADLGIHMLKLDFPRGEYGLFPFTRGYVIKMKEYAPQVQDAIHVFTSRYGYKGLAGTYWDGFTKNDQHMRIFNHFISEYVSSEYWASAIDYPFRVVVDCLDDHNNLPVFFYLIQKIKVDDLNKITLTCPGEIYNCGNVKVCWYVRHSEKGQIGIAVKQKYFFDMMGDQAGICLFAANGFRAIGNFDYDIAFNWRDIINDDVVTIRRSYQCEFAQCSCDTKRNRR